jgi:chromosome segregation ATPase
MTEAAYRSIEQKLNEHGRKLDAINKTLERIAVQDEQLRKHEQEIQAIWRKYDEHLSPCLTQIKTYQATCPRNDIDKRLSNVWWVLGTVGFGTIAMGIALLSLSAKMMGWTR